MILTVFTLFHVLLSLTGIASGFVVAWGLLNFVLVVQLFQKVPVLNTTAPTQAEPPFLVAQPVVLLIFAVLGVRAVISSRSQPLQAA
jgi:ABC-type antimicrobial peptide transport system permease subunit